MFWLRNKKNNFLLRTLIWGTEDIELNPFNTDIFASCEDPDHEMNATLYGISLFVKVKKIYRQRIIYIHFIIIVI